MFCVVSYECCGVQMKVLTMGSQRRRVDDLTGEHSLFGNFFACINPHPPSLSLRLGTWT